MGKNMLTLVRRLGCRDVGLAFPLRQLRLSAMIAACGIQHQTTPGYDWHGLRRGPAKFVSFQYTLAGQGRLVFEGEERTLNPGEAALLYMPHDHRYWVPKGGSWEFFYASMTGRELLRLFRGLIELNGPVLRLREEGPALAAAAKMCAAVLDVGVSSPFAASSLAYGLTMALIEEASTPIARVAEPAWLPRVVSFCQSQLHRPIGVDDLARVARQSRYHFTREFRRARDISPGRYLAEARLKEAARLVLDTRLPMSAVAARSGFSDPNYLSKAFRKEFGVSPSDMRKAGMR